MSLFRGELPFDEIPKTDGTMPEQLKSIEMAYHIPFTWGVLQVSAEAHADSGLIPLVQTVNGPAPTIKIDRESTPQVRVSVIDLSQIVDRDITETTPGAVPIAVSGAVKQGLFEISIGVGKKDALVEGVVSGLKSMFSYGLPWSFEEDELPEGPDGQPFREYMANELPQSYAHILAQTAGETITDMRRSHILIETSNSHVMKNRKAARYALLLTSGFALPNIIQGSNASVAAGFAILELGATSYLINRDDALFIRNNDARQALAYDTARYFGNVIKSSIHEAYCAHVFEEKMQGNNDNTLDN